MNLQEYQDKLRTLSSYPPDTDASGVNAIGVAAEAGEVLGEVQSALRGRVFNLDAYLDELGDVLAYTALFAGNASIQLGDLVIARYGLIQHDHPPTITKQARSLFHCANHLLELQGRMGESFDYSGTISCLLHAIGICAFAVNSSLEEVAEINYIKLIKKFT